MGTVLQTVGDTRVDRLLAENEAHAERLRRLGPVLTGMAEDLAAVRRENATLRRENRRLRTQLMAIPSSSREPELRRSRST